VSIGTHIHGAKTWPTTLVPQLPCGCRLSPAHHPELRAVCATHIVKGRKYVFLVAYLLRTVHRYVQDILIRQRHWTPLRHLFAQKSVCGHQCGCLFRGLQWSRDSGHRCRCRIRGLRCSRYKWYSSLCSRFQLNLCQCRGGTCNNTHSHKKPSGLVQSVATRQTHVCNAPFRSRNDLYLFVM